MLFSPITVPFRLASAFLHSFHISIKLLMQFPHFIWCLHSMLIHKFISKTAFKCNCQHNRYRESRGTRTASGVASRPSLGRTPCRPSRSTACATALRASPTAAACRCSPSPRRSATARRASRARSTRTFSTRRCRMW